MNGFGIARFGAGERAQRGLVDEGKPGPVPGGVARPPDEERGGDVVRADDPSIFFWEGEGRGVSKPMIRRNVRKRRYTWLPEGECRLGAAARER